MTIPTRRSALAIAAGAAGAASLKPGRRKTTPMFSPSLVQVVAGEWRQLVKAGQGPCNLQNRDRLITVYIGSEGSDPAGNTVGIIDPLGSQIVDGKSTVWAITTAGKAIVNVIPGGLGNQVSPFDVQQALQPGFVFATAVNNVSGTSVPIVTFTANSRVWGVTFNLTGISDSAFTGTFKDTANIQSLALGVMLELPVYFSAPSQAIEQSAGFTLTSGINVVGLDEIILNTPAGSAHTAYNITGTIIYSTP